MKKELVYIFYYKLSEYGEKIEVLIKRCKSPKRTKIWKQLNESLDNREVKAIGFDIQD